MSGILQHTKKLGECFADTINSLADNCDNEYYLSVMGSPYGTWERAKRGRLRILKWIIELESISKKASCLACNQEITRQIELQRDGVLEIEEAWKLSE